MPPWDRYAQQAPAQAPQPSQQSSQGGDPIIRPADPYRQSAEERARQDQAFQAEQLRLSREASERAAQGDARAQATFEGTGGTATESQAKVSTMLTRILGGSRDIAGEVQNNSAAQSPGFAETVSRGVMGEGMVTRAISGQDRRIVSDAQRDMIDALLTLSTGAAYTPEQVVAQQVAHFPQYGDTPEEITIKNQRLARLMEAARIAAGPQWGEIEAAITPLMPNVIGATGTQGGETNPDQVYDEFGNPIGANVTVTADIPPPAGGGPNGGGRSPLDDLGAGLGDVVQGAGDLVGLVGNPLNQTINAAFGTDLSTNLGQTARDLSGLPDNPNQLYSAINRGATGALLSAGLAGAAAPAMQAGTSRNVLATLAQSPIRDTAAGAGAGAGAYAGQDYGPVGQVVGGLTGAIIGHGVSGIPGRMQAGRSSTGPQSLGQEAESLGIRMLPADTGGVGTRMATGVSRVTLGEIPIAAAADRAVRSAQTARGRVASDVGNVAADGAAAGQTVSRGLNRWMSETGDRDTGRVSQLFEAVPIERETPLVLDNARQALTELTQGFKSNPQLSRIWVNNPRLRETLEALTPEDVASQGRKDFLRASSEYQDATQAIQVARGRVGGPPGAIQQAEQAAEAARVRMLQAQRQAEREPVGGALSWGDASRLRSIVGEIIDQPGLAAEGNSTAALRRFYGALTSDMEQTAAQAGPRALTMWRRAVQYKRGRESRVNEVITSILGQRGEKTDEAVFQQLNRWTQQKGGDFRSLARTMRSMDADEANTVRATILDRMGNASAGRQNAAGDVFSPAQFVTEFNGLSPRARSVLFPQQEHRQAVEKLVRVMDGMKRAGDYNNTSKTALASNLGIGAVLVGLDQAVTAGLGALGSLVAGRILSSNRLAQMLSRAPRTANPNARNEFVNRLGRATAGNPQLQADVQELQKAILSAVNDNPALPANVAAGESDQQQ